MSSCVSRFDFVNQEREENKIPKAQASYPATVWDGHSPSRIDVNGDNVDIYRKPDADDWEQIQVELIAVENQLETGYQYDIPISFAVTGAVTVANDLDATWKIVSRACKLIKCFAAIKTAPVTGGVQFDIKYSTDNGTTWTSLWATNTGNKPTILTTTHVITQTSFDTTTLAEGTLLRIDGLTIGSGTAGSNLGVILLTRAVK